MIEYWNIKAESFFSGIDYSKGGNLKWRWIPTDTYKRNLEYSYKLEHKIPLEMDLSREQKDEVEPLFRKKYPNIEKLENINRLCDWVSTWGILQYLLAPSMLILSIVQVRRTKQKALKSFGIITLVFSVVAMFLMFYRGYFSSLGL